MKHYIALPVFKEILNSPKLFLPIDQTLTFDAKDNNFYSNLHTHFQFYLERLGSFSKDFNTPNTARLVIRLCYQTETLILKSVSSYLNGQPAGAYHFFDDAMKLLCDHPFYTPHMIASGISKGTATFPLPELFRVCGGKDEDRGCQRKRVFHVPYTIREKVSTNRYSIPGFPCLYLGTSLRLCCEEIGYEPSGSTEKLFFASRFTLQPEQVHFRVVDLGNKPQDMLKLPQNEKDDPYFRMVASQSDARINYLLWYPLISCCAFVRKKRGETFAPEYIIPQLLLQWVRTSASRKALWEKELIGIRYFSCHSEEASKLGHNYVFPTSGETISADEPFCPLLASAFYLTSPVCINDYSSIEACEEHMGTMSVNGIY